MKKRVLLIGTFDALHAGHINLFYNASKLGDVIVGVTSDELNEKNKDKMKLLFNEKQRIKMIEPLVFVKDVFLIDPRKGLTLEKIIKENNITAIAHGSDYSNSIEKKEIANKYEIENLIFNRTNNIDSTSIRNIIKGSL